jgi:hypothetical protein
VEGTATVALSRGEEAYISAFRMMPWDITEPLFGSLTEQYLEAAWIAEASLIADPLQPQSEWIGGGGPKMGETLHADFGWISYM